MVHQNHHEARIHHTNFRICHIRTAEAASRRASGPSRMAGPTSAKAAKRALAAPS